LRQSGSADGQAVHAKLDTSACKQKEMDRGPAIAIFPTAMSLMREIAQSTRSLLKSPSLPAIAILSLGLGVGVNTTLFSVFKSVFLDDISAVQPSRLVEPG
jgi:hypothetical protein